MNRGKKNCGEKTEGKRALKTWNGQRYQKIPNGQKKERGVKKKKKTGKVFD